MKKYLIRKHCEATVICTIALDRIQDYYYGRIDRYLSKNELPLKQIANLYGYDSKAEAVDRLESIKKLEKSSDYWMIITDIVEMEV